MIQHELTPDLERRLAEFRAPPAELAACVQELSNFYVAHPGSPTPWQNAGTATAYLGYYLPLNFVRLRAVFREVMRFLPSAAMSEVWDFGSGTGTTHWVLESSPLEARPFYALERAPLATEWHRKLAAQAPTRWNVQFAERPTPKADALAVFSYSYLEMRDRMPNLKDFAHVLIVEPSTRDAGRALMQTRERLMQNGFQPLAPCTHAEGCPLLLHSNKDWCHQRIHFAGPAWWNDLEVLLPMKNRTLTFSYQLMSQTVRDEQWRGSARAIGDTLEENGKTRQMICRGPQREFLSWLHKRGPAPRIPNGALVRGLEGAEIRGGGEVRPGELDWTE